ncbi:MAG: hypothetical protein CVU90_06180 [Firmicutes bacterium HGW-Firmicutes-15]|nr:MAG: hypothetical protein CVU90_06180 [Firmicutes bacterium HGW-Firmicutes-15]
MAILDVQTMVRRPQEGLEQKNSIEQRSQNLTEKKNSFSQHLKKVSFRELDHESRPLVRKDLPPKNTAFERSTFEQKADSIVDANGEAGKLTPAQEKPNIQESGSEDGKSTEANESVQASVENGSTQELDKQSEDAGNELTPNYSGLVQPERDISITPDSEESKTMPAVAVATAQEAGTQMVSQNQEPLAAMLEAIQPQAAEKPAQASVELIPGSEPAQGSSQAEVNETVLVSNTHENVQEGQAKENRADATASVMTLITEENQGESTASSSSTKVTVKTNPQGETLSVPDNQTVDTETEEIAAKPTVSMPSNPLAVTDNAILTEKPEQTAEKLLTAPTLPGNTSAAALEAEQAKKAGKDSDKDRMKLQFLEKPLSDQVNQKTEEPVAKDVKKIMAIENHRLANSKITADAPLIEEAAQETGVEEGKNLTLLDKTLVELAKPGGETGKAQSTNSARPTVSPEELMEQIVKKVELVTKLATSEMRIQLKPEFLGKMMIQIIVDDGVITARFTTESQHVKQVLEANMNSLKQTLEANGLRVEKTEVNVQLDNGGNFNNSSEGNRQQLWQEMTSQGQKPTHYNSFNNTYSTEVEDFNPYQREADTVNLLDEGRVDFTI